MKKWAVCLCQTMLMSGLILSAGAAHRCHLDAKFGRAVKRAYEKMQGEPPDGGKSINFEVGKA